MIPKLKHSPMPRISPSVTIGRWMRRFSKLEVCLALILVVVLARGSVKQSTSTVRGVAGSRWLPLGADVNPEASLARHKREPDSRDNFGGQKPMSFGRVPTSRDMPHISGTKSPPILMSDPGSPPQLFPNAYVTLIFGTAQLWGSLTLFQSVWETHPRADMVALISNVDSSIRGQLHSLGVRTYTITPIDISKKFDRFYDKRTAETQVKMKRRDGMLWAKLRAWQLDDYAKIISLDSDMLVLKNIDELFLMPEISACPLSDWEFRYLSSHPQESSGEDPDLDDDAEVGSSTEVAEKHIPPIEKIQFWRTPEYGSIPNNQIVRKRNDPFAQGWMLPGWSGLNSGLVVLNPSNTTFSELLDELSNVPSRPCCPSQELLLHFFEKRKRYFRLPTVYNARSLKGAVGYELEAKMRFMKVYHFVSEKPWNRESKRSMHRKWAAIKQRVEERLRGAAQVAQSTRETTDR